MKTLSVSTNKSVAARASDSAPNGKRAIRWTEQEWRDVAVAIFREHPKFSKKGDFQDLTARQVFNAQSCLQRTRQRQLISLAQGFSTTRKKISQIFVQVRPGSGRATITPIPPAQVEAAEAVPASQPEASKADAALVKQRNPHVDSATDTVNRQSQKSLDSIPAFVLNDSPCVPGGVASAVREDCEWTASEWDDIAYALVKIKGKAFNDSPLLNISASDVFAVQLVLPRGRRRTLETLRGSFDSAQSRLSVLVATMSRVSPFSNAKVSSIVESSDLPAFALPQPTEEERPAYEQQSDVATPANDNLADLADIASRLDNHRDAVSTSSVPTEPVSSPIIGAVRPLMRMVFEEFWRAASLHAIPQLATFVDENKNR